MTRSASILLLAILFAACVSNRPYEPLTKAQGRLALAHVNKADLYAAQEFNQAKELLTRADKALYNFEYQEAKKYCEEAEALADLSLTKTQLQLTNQDLSQAERELKLVNKLLMESVDQPLGPISKESH